MPIERSLTVELGRYERILAEKGPLVLPLVAEKIAGISRSSLKERADRGFIGRWSFFGHWWYAVRELRPLRTEFERLSALPRRR